MEEARRAGGSDDEIRQAGERAAQEYRNDSEVRQTVQWHSSGRSCDSKSPRQYTPQHYACRHQSLHVSARKNRSCRQSQ